MIFVSNASFNNIGYPYTSTWVNWGRHTVGTIVPVLIFSAWLGAEGVLIGQAAGGVVFGLLSFVLIRRIMNTGPDAPDPSAQEPFAREGRLMALFHRHR